MRVVESVLMVVVEDVVLMKSVVVVEKVVE